MKCIDYFDRTYVINLPERIDRRREMAEELERIGLPFTPDKVEIFSAVRPLERGEFERIGFKGAFLSHLEVLKKARQDQLKNVLILEDDLEVHQDFLQYETLLLDELAKTSWDVVHFGYCSDQPLHDGEISPPILQPFSGEKWGAHFYAVNGESLDQLIDFFELLLTRPLGHPQGGPMSPDGVFNVFKWQYPHCNRLIASPCLGGQRSSRSDISPSWFDTLPILSSIASGARRLKQGRSSL